jgi:phosphatidylserine/phosphatidylglycerophosphate/cardiolipin synthase-like enzyme
MGEVHVGTVGHLVIPALEKADHSIDVCSPWISTEYAELLLSKARQGVRVRLITTEDQQSLRVLDSPRHDRDIEPERIEGLLNQGFYYLFDTRDGNLVVAIFGLLAFLLGAQSQSWFWLVIGGAFFLLGLLGYRKRTLDAEPKNTRRVLPLTVMTVTSGKFHAKTYIVDGSVAYVGSANLTRSSMYGKKERIEIKSSPREVDQEIQAFSDLWEMED